MADTTNTAMRYARPTSVEEGRIVSFTPDGKWIIEVRFERKTSEEVNVCGHVQQRDTWTLDRIVDVVCMEALDVRSK